MKKSLTACCVALSVSAVDAMVVEYGLMDGMVACRTADDRSQIEIGGKCTGSGTVFVSVDGKRETACGKAEKGAFTGVITTLKTGGPYTVTLRINKEKLSFKNIYVGDLWIMAGQSNMEGNGSLTYAAKNDNPAVRAFYMNDTWDIARDPVHVIRTANARVHLDMLGLKKPAVPPLKNPRNRGAGLGPDFAMKMYEYTKVPQGLIASAHGGTIMVQWDPAKKKDGDASLYGAMLNRVKHNGGKVSGILWYQGESDAVPQYAALYRKRMDDFLAAVRKDLHDPELPFILAQLARVISGSAADWNKVRQNQYDFALKHKNVAAVPVIDLELDDSIHLHARAQHILGQRMAYAVCAMRNMKGFLPPIEFASAKTVRIDGDFIKKIEVTFKNVSGKLKSNGLPSGFFINGKNHVIRTELKGNTVILYIASGTAARKVSYGFGVNPYCNITDQANRSLPCFSEAISSEFPCTPYVSLMQISEPVLMDDDVTMLKYSDIPANVKYNTQKAAGCWMLAPNRLATPHKPGFRFFRVKYSSPKDQKLKLLVGYDGPSKVFFDGKTVHENPDGTNPIVPDQYCIELNWTKGVHEIVVAEVMNNGNAYGITLSIEGYKNTRPGDLPKECSN